MMPEDLPPNEYLEIEFGADYAVIRFINLKERNPLSIIVLNYLHDLLDALNRQPEIAKIVFTGTENIFASGANLREIKEIKKTDAREFALRGQTLMNKIAAARQTTIAAVNGLCFGGAFDLALACDRRIAAPEAVFCHPGANLGIITGWGGTQRLPRLVGEAAALEIFLTAKQINAREALELVLVDEIAVNPLQAALEYLN